MTAPRVVRMGEIAIGRAVGDELIALGLGSCIGLALADRDAAVAGIAHIVLPEAGPGDRQAGRFADLAVPELIARMLAAGALARRLEAVVVGGARMFDISGSLDIGARNERAVAAALEAAAVPVVAVSTGASQGRTLRVRLEAHGVTVTVRTAHGPAVTLLDGGPVAAEGSRSTPPPSRRLIDGAPA